jgi:ATP-binding cassette subfamily B (MDR/TAP) protein 1
MDIIQFYLADPNEVSFGYPSWPNQVVLHESTFFFPAGETTFVVGKSGSGKSTLGNLLMRFYQPTTGQVFIDGTKIRDLDTNWLRNNITLIQQSSILFNETIMRNIAFGQQDFQSVTIEQMKICVGLAALQTTISEMPGGLETMVGARGNALSGGQKQRIAIARARLRDTPILILDEYTSALNYISRTSVTNAIREWRRGKTTVVITHDMGQVEDDDFVYVLDGGYIVEEGYRHSLADSDKTGLFSAKPNSPQISVAPHFDFRLDAVLTLSKSRRSGSY